MPSVSRAVVCDTKAAIKAAENPVFGTKLVAPHLKLRTGLDAIPIPVTDTEAQACQMDWLGKVGTTVYPYEIKTTRKPTHWAYEFFVRDRIGWIDKVINNPSNLAMFDGYDVARTTLIYAWGDGNAFTCDLETFKEWAADRRNYYWLKANDRRGGYYMYEQTSKSLYGGTYTSTGMMIPRQTLVDNFSADHWMPLDPTTKKKVGDAVTQISDANKGKSTP